MRKDPLSVRRERYLKQRPGSQPRARGDFIPQEDPQEKASPTHFCTAPTCYRRKMTLTHEKIEELLTGKTRTTRTFTCPHCQVVTSKISLR